MMHMHTFNLFVAGLTVASFMLVTPVVLAQSVAEAKANVEEKPHDSSCHYDLGLAYYKDSQYAQKPLPRFRRQSN